MHKTKLSYQTQCNAVSSRRTDTKLGTSDTLCMQVDTEHSTHLHISDTERGESREQISRVKFDFPQQTREGLRASFLQQIFREFSCPLFIRHSWS